MKYPTVVVRAQVLTSWLTITEYTKSRLASELGVSRGRISQLLTSNEEPSAHLIAKLLALTHLPFDRLFETVREARPPHRRFGNGRMARANGRKSTRRRTK